MPSESGKQHRFMGLCSTDEGRAKAKGKCPPKSLAQEYLAADKGRHFSKKKATKRKGKRKHS